MKKAADVDAYIAAAPEPARVMLRKIRQIIRAAAPKADEAISYGIPLYRLHGHLVGFGSSRDRCSFYVVSTRRLPASEIRPYKKAKTTLHFPLDKPLPVGLVKRIVKARIKENEARARD